jgi:hypothetical protein
MAFDHTLPVPALRTPGKRAEKKYSRFKLRNPLKNLDSDERIQGNPRKSNAHERGPSQRNGQGQENPNGGATGPMARPAAEKEPNRLLPKAKRHRLKASGRAAARRAVP